MPSSWSTENPFQASPVDCQSPGNSPSPRSGMPPSGAQSPHTPDDPPKQKRVGWILSEDEEEAEDEPQSSRQGAERVDLERQLTKEENDELRREIHAAFGSTPPDSPHSTRSGHDNGSRDSPRGRSSNASPTRQPKSVLRKGDITPTEHNVVSHEELEEGIEEKEKKKSSAVSAKHRAEQMARSLDVSPEPSERDNGDRSPHDDLYHEGNRLVSGQTTPESHISDDDDDRIPKPSKYRVSGLSAMTMLNKMRYTKNRLSGDVDAGNSRTSSRASSPSGSATRLFKGSSQGSNYSLRNMVPATVSSTGLPDLSKAALPEYVRRDSDTSSRGPTVKKARQHITRASSSNAIDTLGKMASNFWKGRSDSQEEIRIKKHVEETQARHKYLMKLCRALMFFGAPTHRLEEYMRASARILEVEAQFLYIPGCMILSFDDSNSHTAEVKLVRTNERIDLGKLRDTHDVYKHVVHDVIGVQEATRRLDEIMNRKKKFKLWFRIFAYGVASVAVGPFAFKAQAIDLPIAFILGCILGGLQLFISTKTDLYTAVFEIFAVALTSLLARAFGSIRRAPGEYIFCYSALAQSAIALILPGYLVLCAALELQSRSMVAGSVRLVYAIIYSLFLGVAITIGSAIYGVFDSGASSSTACDNPILGYWVFWFVPLFAISLMIVNQAKWKQMPVMTVIAFAGYVMNYFAVHDWFDGNSQVAAAVSGFVISILANLYGRTSRKCQQYFERSLMWLQRRFGTERTAHQGKSVPEDQPSTPSSLEKQVTATRRERRHWMSLKQRIARLIHNPRKDADEEEVQEDESKLEKVPSEQNSEKQSRVSYPLAAAAMLPAIFVLVPSGVASGGSLLTGLQSADQLVNQRHSSGTNRDPAYHSISFTVAYSVVQIAVGITVGLFLGNLIVYPFGKGGKFWRSGRMRSGLFSF